MGKPLKPNSDKSSAKDVDAFLKKVADAPAAPTSSGTGRLLFAIDATASRQATWDQACHIQCEMFEETANVGTLSMQVAFFRGFGEFKATPWTSKSDALIGPMSRVQCLGGHTQIEKILKHALKTNKKTKINAVIYIGDCMEEDPDQLCHLAGQLGFVNTPVFIFQEGYEPRAEACFRQMAKLTSGAFFRFDTSSASILKDLLKAIAVYAVGGRKALQDLGNRKGGETLLLAQKFKK